MTVDSLVGALSCLVARRHVALGVPWNDAAAYLVHCFAVIGVPACGCFCVLAAVFWLLCCVVVCCVALAQDSTNFKEVGKQVLQDFHDWVQVRVCGFCVVLK